MTMWIYEDESCIHGIEGECAQCIDLLQVEDGAEFLRRIGMGVG